MPTLNDLDENQANAPIKDGEVKPQADGSHDDLGGLDTGEQAKFDQIAAGLKDSSSGSGGGLYRPSSESEERASLGASAAGGIASKFNPKAKIANTALNFIKNNRASLGGAAGFSIIIIFLIFFMLAGGKVKQAIADIESRVGKVPEYAVERRLEYYMNQYLIIRTVAKLNPNISEAQLKERYTYLGKGTFGTLYNNWQGAKLDVKMQAKGIRLEPKLPKGEVLGRRYTKPSEWNLIDADGTVTSLDSVEARATIKGFAKEETRWFQVLKRYNMRSVLKKYNGISNWKPFERKVNNAKAAYAEKKVAFKRLVVRNTVGKASKSWSAYMSCMIQGGKKDACKDLRKSNPPSADPDIVDNLSDADVNVDAEIDLLAKEGVEEVDKVASRSISEKLTKVSTKKLLASAVAGIGIADTASKIVLAINNGALSQVVYTKNATQYAGFGAAFLSGQDQLDSGIDVDSDHARILAESLKDFEKSRVYQAGRPSGVDTTKRVAADCNNDGDTTDTDDVIEAGSLVCENKKVLQTKETFTNNPSWKSVAAVAETYDKSIGWAVEKVNEAVGAVTKAARIDEAIAKLMEISGLDKKLAEGFGKVLEIIAGPVVTGGETGPAAYDALYAAISVNKSSLGGGVGENREDTIGGQYLSPQKVAQIKEDLHQDRQIELRREGTFARYFSPDIPESLTSQAMLATPSSVTQAATSFGSLLNPSRLFGSISSGFTASASAQSTTADNPFGVLYYGYPVDHPSFDESLEPDAIDKQFNCSKSVEDRNKNSMGRPEGIPFDVPVKTDPCLLEKAVEDAGSRYFTGAYDEGIDEGSKRTSGGQTGLLNPGGLAWPTKAEGSHISSCFNEPRSGGPHKGMDIAIAADTPAFAVADGEVIIAGGKADGYGPNYVAIKHTKADGTTFVSGYGHMNSKTVEVGDKVTQAQQVGTIGSLGYSTGPHMHVIINVGGKDNFNGDVDPLTNGMEVPPGALNAKGCPKY